MYEELVGRMRERADSLYNASRFYDSDAEDAAILYKAADAIETLIGKVKYLIERCDMVDKNCSEAVRLGALWKEAALERMPRWIPVTEQLPIRGDRVICFGENGINIVDFVCGDKWFALPWFYLDGELDGEQETVVTHWMPLPEPPKGE